MTEQAPKWIALAAEARRRGMEPRELRSLCHRLGVVLVGSRKRPMVVSVEIDDALDRVRRGIAVNDAEAAEIERGAAMLPRMKPRAAS